MPEEIEEIDIFRALAHPLRRRILLFLYEKDFATHSDLSKIESKAGVLYHHLRLLKGLVEKDEKRRYFLTEKGKEAVRILLENYFYLADSGLSRILLRREFEKTTKFKIVLSLSLFFITLIMLSFQRKYTLFLLLIIPIELDTRICMLTYLCSWIFSTLLAVCLAKVLYGKSTKIHEVLWRTAFSFIFLILLLIPVEDPLSSALQLLAQILLLFYFTSLISVTLKIWLKRAAVITLLIHYTSLLVYVITTM